MIKNHHIAIVGTGRMGANIARRLHEKGYALRAVFDKSQDVAEALAQELGVEAPKQLSQLSAQSDIILTVVSDDEAMNTIFTEQGDSLLQNAKGKIFINCATVSPSIHQEVEKRCTKAGAYSLEACMASSITQARQGTLYLMIGGDKEIFERVEPLLKDLSSSLRYVGKAGEAGKVKALVNMVMNINTAGLAEGLGLGAALGLDLEMLKAVFSKTGANSRVLETDGADMIQREHECYFSAAHAAKDSGIANALAKEFAVEVPLSLATENQYKRLMELGKGELDKSAVAELTFPGRNT